MHIEERETRAVAGIVESMTEEAAFHRHHLRVHEAKPNEVLVEAVLADQHFERAAVRANDAVLPPLIDREALENVLVPYKLMENREMLLRAGFRYCDVFFKWYNFMGMIAVK